MHHPKHSYNNSKLDRQVMTKTDKLWRFWRLIVSWNYRKLCSTSYILYQIVKALRVCVCVCVRARACVYIYMFENIKLYLHTAGIIFGRENFPKRDVFFFFWKWVAYCLHSVFNIKSLYHILKTMYEYRVEPAYNDNGLCDTSSIASNILWYQLLRHG
jgi:hypothetical protein